MSDEAREDEEGPPAEAGREATADAKPATDGAAARRLDFADPARRPSLDALVASAAERLAAELSRGLGSALRFPVSCSNAPPARRRGAEIVAGLPPDALCVPLALGTPNGEAWLVVERALPSALADRRYGGGGRAHAGRRPVSPSERRLGGTLVEALRVALERAWRPVTPLTARTVELAGDPADGVGRARFAATGAEEAWHECAVRVSVDAGAGKGAKTGVGAGDAATDEDEALEGEVVDAAGSNPDGGAHGGAHGGPQEGGGVCTVLLAHSCIGPLAPRAAAPLVHRPGGARGFGDAFADGVRGCDVELVGVLAEQRISLGELAALAPGDFIALDERRAVRFRAGTRPVFDARMGLDDGRVSASVTRLHLPLRDGET